MAIAYSKVKSAVIDIIDDFSVLDINVDYGSKYKSSTKLTKIGINVPILAVMPPRFNKVMRALAGTTWRAVGPIDLVPCESIGDLIFLACGQSGALLPQGEPS